MSSEGNYGASSISILRGLEAVQQRPGMYVGDVTTFAATHHLLYEIFDNAVDEALAGHANTVTVTLHEDGSAEVSDNGRGIPVDIHPEEGVSAAEVVFTSLHSGGKFDNDSYKYSGGLHGVGAACTNALSDWLAVEVKRDGGIYAARFELGKTINPITRIGDAKNRRDTGTRVRFKPSSKFLKDIVFQSAILAQRFKVISYLNAGLRIQFIDKITGTNEIYHFEGGIAAFVRDNCVDRPLISPILRFEGEVESVAVDVAFAWVGDDVPEEIKAYTNNIPQPDGGQHVTGFRAAASRTVLSYGENMGILRKTSKVTADDIREGMVVCVSVRHPDPAFSSQTKEKLISTEARTAVETVLSRELGLWLDANPDNAKAIIERAKAASEAREAAKKARELSRDTKAKKVVSSASLPDKLADCSSKDVSVRELFLVEGDSAGGSAKQGRNRETQAILPLRGKILNVERAKQSAILGSAEISGMLQTIGAGVGKNLDLSRMRYDKIVVMTDADVDGSHIATLIMTFFFRQLRPLIENGHIYIAAPPLYRLRRKGEEDTFIRNERDLIQSLVDRTLGQKLVEINKSPFSGEEAQSILSDLINQFENIPAAVNTIGHPVLADAILGAPDLAGVFGLGRPPSTSAINRGIKHVKQICAQYDTEADWEFDLLEDRIIAKRIEDAVADIYDLNPSIMQSWRVKAVRQASEKAGLCDGAEFTVSGKKIAGPVTLLEAIRMAGLRGAQLSRYKGLGEMNPEELWQTTMDPAARTLRQVHIDDLEVADRTFSDLMADNVVARRKLIEEMCAGATDLDI